ncbi:hypothetical protein [Nannocystis pusilla]|uniref:hypothetical protein n=1 Tax=Nannocystis pusilla TaxID=889268 RepID=UPI003B798DC4
MSSRRTYFWKPRGDARVVASEGDRVPLAVVLANYGEGADSWDLDCFNALEFVALQCIVGFWTDAKWTVASQGPRATPALIAAVEGHAHAAELDRLAEVSRPRREHASDDDWWEFSEAATRIVREVELSRIGGAHRTLRLRAADPSWIAHMAPLADWCLG